jgi:membrane-bound lytic murein transglycosylase B
MAAAALTGQPTGSLPSKPPRDPRQLAAALSQAEHVIDDPASPAAELQGAGRFQQLATFELAAAPVRRQRTVLAGLRGSVAASLRADLLAAAALSRLNQPRRSLPPWKIIAPPPPATLLGYFKAAQSRSGVPWQYLAAIEKIESDFGRVVGLSTAGAEGPMQFMPSTWAEYGRGDVHNPRDAIFAAARYLVANGAPRDMPDAIYHYNPSPDYVAAVRAYAGRMSADPRAFYGYYYWQVIYAHVGGPMILPVGFPKARPIRLGLVEGP